MKNTEHLNERMAYWQDMVYYYTDRGELEKAAAAKLQLEAYRAKYYSL